jgi:E3 ubiquitin-protein ligase synoviolin
VLENENTQQNADAAGAGARPAQQAGNAQQPNAQGAGAGILNQGGWFGRWNFQANANVPPAPIVPDVAQAAAHGQPNGAGLQNGVQIQNVAWAANPGQQLPPPNVVIQYHFPYDPRQQPQQQQHQQRLPGHPLAAPAPQQQLQPLPIFGGFHGPAGWQPWNVDGRLFGHGQQPQRNAVNQPQNAEQAPPVVNATDSAATASSSQSVTRPPASLLNAGSDDIGSRPGEAAAVAALRRAGQTAGSDEPATDSSTSTASSSSASSVSDAGSRHSPSAMASHANVNPTPSSSAQPGPSPSGGGPSAATHTSRLNGTAREAESGPIKLPGIIPLYDYGSLVTPSPSSSSQNSSRTQLQSSHARVANGTRPCVHQQAAAASSRPAVRRPNPLAQLPQTLTDEQLATLDRVTRDAIDERLRVLEGVSGTLYSCIAELLRMRSALPLSSGPRPTPTSATQPTSQSPQEELPPGSSASATDMLPASSSQSPTDALRNASKPDGDVDGTDTVVPDSSDDTPIVDAS